MIVVVGQPLYSDTATVAVAGIPAGIALAAAAGGHAVQLVGKAGEDDAGDAVVMALAKGGVGHVALLREAGRSTVHVIPPASGEVLATETEPISAAIEPEDVDAPASASTPAEPSTGLALEAADVDLALRYLTDFGVLVIADPVSADVLAVAAAAATWSDARLMVLLSPGEVEPTGLPDDAIVFEAPDSDDDGAFASMVGAFAAALDDGEDPAAAFQSTVEGAGWTAAPAE